MYGTALLVFEDRGETYLEIREMGVYGMAASGAQSGH